MEHGLKSLTNFRYKSDVILRNCTIIILFLNIYCVIIIQSTYEIYIYIYYYVNRTLQSGHIPLEQYEKQHPQAK